MLDADVSWLEGTVALAGGKCSAIADQETAYRLDRDLQCQVGVASMIYVARHTGMLSYSFKPYLL